jgi:hypothetical protein
MKMDYLDLNIPEWQYMGYESEEDYEEEKQNNRYLINDFEGT